MDVTKYISVDPEKKYCCKNCRFHKNMETWVYDDFGVDHKKDVGFACLGFLNEGLVINLVGIDEESEMCEMFAQKTYEE